MKKKAPESRPRVTEQEIGRLIENLDFRARPPRHFGLWSRTMLVAWLRQNQKKRRAA